MDEPLPIVPRSMHLENLSDYLERGTGAVLVEAGDDGRYDILTKSDLISALSHLSNGERG
jgi:predicted transcriptional regulator